jgi:hypothetical protein
MTGHKGIRYALTWLGEACDSTKLAQTLKIRLASGQQLMDIRLVTHIKYQAVYTCIIYSLKSNRQLHRTQIGGEVSAGLGHTIDQKLTNLLAQQQSFFIAQALQILVTADVL